MFLFFSSFLFAQNTPDASSKTEEADTTTITTMPFCIGSILQIASAPDINFKNFWRPDFPLNIPPDAFNISDASAITLTLIDQSQNIEGEFVLRYDTNKRIIQFPFIIDGNLAQIKLTRNTRGTITAAHVEIQQTKDQDSKNDADKSTDSKTADTESNTVSIDIEFVKFDDDNKPTIARIKQDDTWRFAAFNNNAHIESVSDENGVLQGAFILKYFRIDNERINEIEYNYVAPAILDSDVEGEDLSNIQTFFYDSFGNISGISQSDKNGTVMYSAYFNDKGLVRLDKKTDTSVEDVYNFQWDEKRKIVSMNCISADKSGGAKENNARIEKGFIYEYTFDKRGNWIERRQIQMNEYDKFSSSSAVTVCKRTIQYR
ncbi:hypothetical protein FACS1894102_0730 [Spirochaetia bacterium]|nr:hypothetical protein FACS1894102_0730 [Spirochaetia bacterium]